ncbi:hypothetical protein EC844_12521 [Acinetobacter calcoaceticus]|uniref:Uncharacterized protein n=1 Tax=Acinetobacter calcoaceticus TaxID=471 RepID=A0A4R1XRJ8_ACICA|nr:hypothetical protein EC844_12521 [Acinetobacter calcoaceticus]
MTGKIITAEKLRDADRDADSMDKFVSGGEHDVVKTRRNKTYPTQPNIARQLLENGGYRGFANETELKKYIPTTSNVIAKDMETFKLWQWDGVKWSDTGKSELDQAVERVQQQIPKLESSTENIFTVTDANGVETWISADADGEPTPKSLSSIQKVQKFKSDEYAGLHFTDENGVLFDLSLNADGSFSDSTKESLETNGAGLSNDDFYFDSDNKVKKLTGVKFKAAILGSSTLELMQNEMSVMLSDNFKFNDIYKGGKSGERVEQIANKFGAIPVKLTFENDKVNAAGSTNVVANFDGITDLSTEKSTAKIDGAVHVSGEIIEGSFAYYSADSTFKFTRLASGIAIDASDEYEFISDYTDYSTSDLLILNAGKNNVGRSEHGTAEYIADATLRIFKHMQALSKRVIVVSHFSNTVSSDAILKVVNDVNEQYRKQYSSLFFDMNAYLLSSQIWSDTSIIPNSNDIQKQSEGRLPLSLSRDTGGHLNDAANAAVIQKLKQFISEKGWY